MAKAKTYMCSGCGNEFESDWTDEDAAAEFEQNFGHSDRSNAVAVCDDCYWLIMAPTTRTREQHMAFCKERAIAVARSGDITGAFTSMISDLGKHHETVGHPAIMLGMLRLMTGDLSSPDAMEKFIDGFN